MGNSQIDDLARFLGLESEALEAAVPGLTEIMGDPRLFGLIPLIAASLQRSEPDVCDEDAILRAHVLRYEASSLMTDRERARYLGLPTGCRIRERAKILAPDKLKLGKYVWIGEGAMLDAQGGLSIGDNSQIGVGVFVWSHSSHLQAVRGETTQSRKSIVYKHTTIGKNCFIVGPSVITAGVTIGDGAMISPLTFVDRDVAAGEHVSSPRSLRKLEHRIQELEEKLDALSGNKGD